MDEKVNEYIKALEIALKLLPTRCMTCEHRPCSNPQGYRFCNKWKLGRYFFDAADRRKE